MLATVPVRQKPTKVFLMGRICTTQYHFTIHPPSWVAEELPKCCGLEIKRRKRKEEQPHTPSWITPNLCKCSGKGGRLKYRAELQNCRYKKRKTGRKTVVTVSGHNMSVRTISFLLLRIMCFAGKVIHTDIIKKSWMRSPALGHIIHPATPSSMTQTWHHLVSKSHSIILKTILRTMPSQQNFLSFPSSRFSPVTYTFLFFPSSGLIAQALCFLFIMHLLSSRFHLGEKCLHHSSQRTNSMIYFCIRYGTQLHFFFLSCPKGTL